MLRDGRRYVYYHYKKSWETYAGRRLEGEMKDR